MSKRSDELIQKYNIQKINLRILDIDPSVIKILNPTMVNRFKTIPVYRVGNCLTIAIAEPNEGIQTDIAFMTDYRVEFVLSDPDDISEAIRKYYPVVTGNEPNCCEIEENSGLHVIEIVPAKDFLDEQTIIKKEIEDHLSEEIGKNLEKFMKLFGHQNCEVYDYNLLYNNRTPEGLVIIEFEKVLTNKRMCWSLMDIKENIIFIEEGNVIKKMKILYKEDTMYLVQPFSGGKALMIRMPE